jgi:hypothetical protein
VASTDRNSLPPGEAGSLNANIGEYRLSIRQGAHMAGDAVPPETNYARVGSDRLAYQVLGKGPPDLVFTMGPFSHVDIFWEDPQMALSCAGWPRSRG